MLINEESFVINDDDELVVSITAAVPATKASQNKHVLAGRLQLCQGTWSIFQLLSPEGQLVNLSELQRFVIRPECTNLTFCGKPWLKAILFISIHLLFYFGVTFLLELPHAAEISGNYCSDCNV